MQISRTVGIFIIETFESAVEERNVAEISFRKIGVN